MFSSDLGIDPNLPPVQTQCPMGSQKCLIANREYSGGQFEYAICSNTIIETWVDKTDDGDVCLPDYNSGSIVLSKCKECSENNCNQPTGAFGDSRQAEQNMVIIIIGVVMAVLSAVGYLFSVWRSKQCCGAKDVNTVNPEPVSGSISQ